MSLFLRIKNPVNPKGSAGFYNNLEIQRESNGQIVDVFFVWFFWFFSFSFSFKASF